MISDKEKEREREEEQVGDEEKSVKRRKGDRDSALTEERKGGWHFGICA